MAHDFNAMYASIQSWVDREFLVGASAAVLVGGEVVDVRHWGFASHEAGTVMDDDVIFRIFSNTKWITSVAAMLLVEDGALALDDALDQHLPEFSDLRVLRPGATSLEDTEALIRQPTVRELFCHCAGFTYGPFQEGFLDGEYMSRGLLSPDTTLEETVTRLSGLPLARQPGLRWQYSIATDVLARLVEVCSGMTFDAFLRARLFEPLGMVDTDFWVPPEKAHRLAGNYVPVDPMDPMKPGINAAPDVMLGAATERSAFLSGGGGLLSTLADYTRFVRMLVNDGIHDGERIVRSETLAEMWRNQLPPGKQVELPQGWEMPDTTFGLGFAIKDAPAPGEPDTAIGEVHWGGLAGTHTWIAPSAGVAALIFTQRLPGFWHPFSHDFKREVYAATR